MNVDSLGAAELDRLNQMSALELLRFAWETFGARAAIGTSMQITGSALIDIAYRHSGHHLRVFTIDTLRLQPESYELIQQIAGRYQLKLEFYKPDEQRLKSMVDRFGEYLFFTDKAKQEYCCQVRKVEPNRRAMDTLDCWITGLRNDQSTHRGRTAQAELLDLGDRRVLKLCPLASWSEKAVWAYIKAYDIPYNSLYDRGYDSIGCVICSTPLLAGEPPRRGRWRWQDHAQAGASKKECGIHNIGVK